MSARLPLGARVRRRPGLRPGPAEVYRPGSPCGTGGRVPGGGAALVEVDEGRDTALSGWRGAAAEAFAGHMGALRPEVAEFVELAGRAAAPLFVYADVRASRPGR